MRQSISAQSWLSTPPAPGRDLHERLALVVLPRQQRADLEAADLALQVGQLGVGLGLGALVVLLGGHLEQHAEVVEPAAQRLDAVDVALHRRQPGGDLLRLGRVVPQVGLAGLRLEVRQLDAQPRQVEHLLDAGQRGVEGGEVGTAVGGHDRARLVAGSGQDGRPCAGDGGHPDRRRCRAAGTAAGPSASR